MCLWQTSLPRGVGPAPVPRPLYGEDCSTNADIPGIWPTNLMATANTKTSISNKGREPSRMNQEGALHGNALLGLRPTSHKGMATTPWHTGKPRNQENHHGTLPRCAAPRCCNPNTQPPSNLRRCHPAMMQTYSNQCITPPTSLVTTNTANDLWLEAHLATAERRMNVPNAH